MRRVKLFVGSVVAIALSALVGCGGSPLQPAPSTPIAPDSTTLVIGATAETTTKTGIVQWEVSRIGDGVAANGVDSSGKAMTKLVMRGVDNQDGTGVVAELTTDGSIVRVTKDGRVLLNEMAPAMFQYLGRDVQAYQAQNHVSSALSCVLATAAAVAASVAVVATCITPVVVVPAACATAVAAYFAALALVASECG